MAAIQPSRWCRFAVDLLKLLRAQQYVTRAAVAEEFDCKSTTAGMWLAEMQANGIVIADRVPTTRRGREPVRYSLAPEWRGGS